LKAREATRNASAAARSHAADCQARESGLDVRKVITHRLPAEKFLEGFETMRRGESGKIVLHWGGE
jgi:threonine dehydrogenase-like Zn-dependent dehydrogenase